MAGRRSATQFPHAAIILATGVTTVPATTSLRPGIIAYLTKPFSDPDVRTALQRRDGLAQRRGGVGRTSVSHDRP